MEESKDFDARPDSPDSFGSPKARSPLNGPTSSRKLPKWVALEELERERTRVSMNKDRVKTITQKLSKLQQGLEVDKSRSRNAFETRIRDLETKINSVSSEQDQRLEEADQQIEHLMEALGQERLARELLDERKTKEGELLSRTVGIQLEELKVGLTAAQNAHNGILEKVEKQIEQERVIRLQNEERFGIQLTQQVTKLAEEVQLMRQQNMHLNERVLRLDTTIAEERKARSDLEEHFVNLLEDLCNKLRNEIVAERTDREAMEETLLKLIEETCARVEGGLVSSTQ